MCVPKIEIRFLIRCHCLLFVSNSCSEPHLRHVPIIYSSNRQIWSHKLTQREEGIGAGLQLSPSNSTAHAQTPQSGEEEIERTQQIQAPAVETWPSHHPHTHRQHMYIHRCYIKCHFSHVVEPLRLNNLMLRSSLSLQFPHSWLVCLKNMQRGLCK